VGREQLESASREELIERLIEVEQQLRWFKQQLFGRKSERRIVEPDPAQLSLGEGLVQQDEPTPTERVVRAHTRRPRRKKDETDDPGLSFDDSVPVERIVVSDPALEDLVEGVDYTVISEKKSYRLAQQPAAYTVLEIVRPVVKLAETGRLETAVAPASVIPSSSTCPSVDSRYERIRFESTGSYSWPREA